MKHGEDCPKTQPTNKTMISGGSAVQPKVGRKSSPIGTPPVNVDMYRGYFPLWRKITDWGWYKDSNTKAVFLHLLLTMNHHKESDFKGHKIKKGQCVHGRKELSAVLGLSEMQVRTAINHLKSTNEITTETTNRFTIYTLTNYEKYFPKSYTDNQPDNQQITNKQPTDNQQITTSNKDKNIKNDKNIDTTRFAYLENNLFKELWEGWLETRKKMKVPNTKRSLEIALRKLHGQNLDIACSMLERSIERGWRGIFVPQETQDKKGGLEEW